MSQFIATPLDTQMMYNVMKERQSVYDQLSTVDITPQFNYIKASDFDMGHQKEANEVYGYFENVADSTRRMLEEDNLAGAQKEMMKAIRNKDMQSRIRGLNYAFDADKQYREQIEKESNLDHRRRLMNYYMQNRMQGRDFNAFVQGGESPINQPYLTAYVDSDKKIKEASSMLHSSGFPLGDGTILKYAKDAQGNMVPYMYSQDGKVTAITEKDAYNKMSAYVMSDPEIQQYAHFMDTIGEGEWYRKSLDNQIRGAAFAKSFVDISKDTQMHKMDSDWWGDNPNNTKGFIREMPAASNPYNAANSDKYKLEDGKIKEKTSKTVTDGRTGIERKIFAWEEKQVPTEQSSYIMNNFLKVIDPQTGQASIVLRSQVQEGQATMEIEDAEAIQAVYGLENSMSNVSFSIKNKYEKETRPEWNRSQLNASGINSGQIRVMGKNGDLQYEVNKISDIPEDVVFYETGVTINHPEYGAGKKVFVGESKSGNTYEFISNSKDMSLSPITDQIDQLTEFSLNNEKFERKIKFGDQEFLLQKRPILFQDPTNGKYSTQEVPPVYMIPIVDGVPVYEEATHSSLYINELIKNL